MTATPRSRPPLPRPIAPYVPQTQGMCLLARLLEVDDAGLCAEARPGRDDLFTTRAGIPAWVGLEWMAQAVAAWAGWHAAGRGEPPALGLLIGTRRFATDQAHFALETAYRVRVRLEYRADNGLGHFRGAIVDGDGRSLAEADLTVFEPGLDHPSEPTAGEPRP